MYRQVTGKEVTKNMEYLLNLLHKEWERSGKTKAIVTINFADNQKVDRQLALAIMENTEQLADKEPDFKTCMELSKESFVLLRLVKKITRAQQKADKMGMDSGYMVELDKDEYKLFAKIVVVQEE